MDLRAISRRAVGVFFGVKGILSPWEKMKGEGIGKKKRNRNGHQVFLGYGNLITATDGHVL